LRTTQIAARYSIATLLAVQLNPNLTYSTEWPYAPMTTNQMDTSNITDWLMAGYDESIVRQYLAAAEITLNHPQLLLDLRCGAGWVCLLPGALLWSNLWNVGSWRNRDCQWSMNAAAPASTR
jgi:hypothetical protein